MKIVDVKLEKRSPKALDDVDETLVFKLADGETIKLELSGDCCSHSYFEKLSVKDAKEMVGRDLVRIEHIASWLPNSKGADDSTRYHAVSLITSDGMSIIDWRNESNGYYDGTCNVVVSEGAKQSVKVKGGDDDE